MDLSKVSTREKLDPAHHPHWQRLAVGCHLGFAPSKVGKHGAWHARCFDSEARKQHAKALGDFGHLPPNERFTAAAKAARDWFDHLSGGGAQKSITVREACERYAAGNPEAAARFKRYVDSDPIGKVIISKLTKEQVRAWRKRLVDTPALVALNNNRGKSLGKPITRERSPATVNRDMVPLRAALNLALDHGDALNDQAWRVALRPIKKADGRRNLYLDRDQRRALLEKLPADAKAFARGLCSLPLRPGALAGLLVGDFDARRNELTIERDKSGDGRKILLPADTAAMLKEQARDKLPAAPLFARWDGKAWLAYMWKGPIKQAVIAAGLPAGTTAYTLRHSTITDLVQGGLDLLTIAQVSGTSVAMIEKHYGHLQRKRAAEALAGLAL